MSYKITKLISGDVYTGDKSTYIPKGKRINLVSTDPVNILCINLETGEIKKPYLVNVNNQVFKSPGYLTIKASKGVVWSIDFQDETKTNEVIDSDPMETDVEEPLPILQRMQEMIKNEVIARYGANSVEVETLEDAMDFDIDDDGIIGSPYEEQELEIIPPEQYEAELQAAEPKADNPDQVDIEEEIATKTASKPPQE